MRNAQDNCDGNFVNIQGQLDKTSLPNKARPNDERVPEDDYPVFGFLFLRNKTAERNADYRGWAFGNVPILQSIPPLHDVAVPQQGKLNQFFELWNEENIPQGGRSDRKSQLSFVSQLKEQLQSKRTSPILVEGNRAAIKEWATGSSNYPVIRKRIRILRLNPIRKCEYTSCPSNRRGVAPKPCPSPTGS